MSGALRLGHHGLQVLRPGGPRPEGQVMRFPGPLAARDLLQRLSLDPTNMSELRRVHGAERGRAALPGRPDREVLDQLAARLATGALFFVILPAPPITIVLTGSGPEVKPSRPKPVNQGKKTAAELTPELTLIGWSAPRVAVGGKVQAVFAVKGFDGGESATVTIFEHDGSGAKKQIAKVAATVETQAGEVRVDWSRSEDEASADLEEDREAGDAGPVEYRFQVKAGKLTAEGESGPLWLTHTVEVSLEAEGDGAEAPDGAAVTLWDALGEEVTTKAKKGKATFEKVLVGPFQIELGGAPSPFSDLRWSAPKVEVGAEVEASFAFKGLEDGQEVVVRILEQNADGSVSLVDSITTQVSGESGEHRVKWSRSEDGASADALQDEAEGDAGPVEYRFALAAGAKRSEARSGPLWLTHTVEVSLSVGRGKAAMDDGVELELTAADGASHRAKTSSGKARFEDVVVGPMKLALAGRGGD